MACRSLSSSARSFDVRFNPQLLRVSCRIIVGDIFHFHGGSRTSLRCRCSSAQQAHTSDRVISSSLASSLLCQPMQTPQGQHLMAIMANQSLPLGLISLVASQQLELLATTAAASSWHVCAQADQGMLNRMEELNERERSKAVQEIIYAIVASKLLSTMLGRLEEHTSHPDSVLTFTERLMGRHDMGILKQAGHVHGLNDRLQAIHPPEVQRLTTRHVTTVIYGKGCTKISLDPNTPVHVDRLEIGRMYAASIMYGYFLARVQQRFQLDQKLLIHASSIRSSIQADPIAPSLEAYMEGDAFQDAGILRQLSSISSLYTLQVIEHHCEALFADHPFHLQRKLSKLTGVNTNIRISLSLMTSLIYLALAFGVLLWDVEHNFAPLYPHICDDKFRGL